MPLLTSILVIVSAVAKRGSVTAAASQTGGAAAASLALAAAGAVDKHLPELAALAEGGAWGTVYDALKGPIMARAAELQSGATGTGGKKTEPVAVTVDLAGCLDNMARCAEVGTRVVAKSECTRLSGTSRRGGGTRRFDDGRDIFCLESSSVAVCGNSSVDSGVAHGGGECFGYSWAAGLRIMRTTAERRRWWSSL